MPRPLSQAIPGGTAATPALSSNGNRTYPPPMHLAVLGATGRTGRPLVEQALAAGHTVVALVRTPTALDLAHPGLTIVPGDATDADAVAHVVAGADAALSTLGPTKGAPPDLLTRAARNVRAAMEQHGVRRYVGVSGAGVPDPKDPPYWQAGVIRGLMKIVAKDLLEDSIRSVNTWRTSGLDWTVVRAPRLADGPATGRYEIGYFKLGFVQIPRADVAAFMLRAATENLHTREAPMIRPA